jgi:hypothetical protein
MMDDCNARDLTPLRKSSIDVLSPRLAMAEHWDTIENIPEKKDWKNPKGKL